jgi:CRISPR-associated protein Cas2
MIFEFMRIIVFFDLPVETAKDRKIYANFRKYLIKNGYNMLQYSVYAKIANNRDAARKHILQLRRNVPSVGSIRVMLVTEKQYSRMEIIIGGKSRQEEKVTPEPLLIF